MNEIERCMFMTEMKLAVFDSVKLVDRQSESQTSKLDPKQSFIRLTINHQFFILSSNKIFNIII